MSAPISQALPIVLYPDDNLRKVCPPVETMNDQIANLIDEMLYTMYHAPGIGLAAPQVDVLSRVIVVDVSEGKNDPLALINPQILHASGSIEWEEGCLSIPGVYGKVVRPSQILVKALDRDGKPLEFQAFDLEAVCIQHEIDHLNGTLFIDHLSALKRNRLIKKMITPEYPTKKLATNHIL